MKQARSNKEIKRDEFNLSFSDTHSPEDKDKTQSLGSSDEISDESFRNIKMRVYRRFYRCGKWE